MASLEELLAKEGFKKGKTRPRWSNAAATAAMSLPHYTMSKENPLFTDESDPRSTASKSRSDAFSRRSQSMQPSLGSARARTKEGSRSSALRCGDPAGSRSSAGMQPSPDRNSVGSHGSKSSVSSKSNKSFRLPRKESSDQNNSAGSHGSKSNKNIKAKHIISEDDARTKLPKNNATGPPSEPALDEAAIQAVVSILTSHLRRFFRDETFLLSIRRGCYLILESATDMEGERDQSVMANLKEGIRTVEKAAKKDADERELKKAVVKLSLITGLSAPDLKDSHTSGIPNTSIAACAHLYLSVVYKLQKKEQLSAKHLLQVFIDSPHKARTTLLPPLWERLFLPHFMELRKWYEQEAETSTRASNKLMNVQILDQLYNDTLDTGTYEFAVYYKKWITEGSEPPELPVIPIPSPAFTSSSNGDGLLVSDGTSSSSSPKSSRPMVSKALYESMFSQPRKTMAPEELGSRDEEEEAEETRSPSPRSETNTRDGTIKYYRFDSSSVDSASDIPQSEEWTAKKYFHSTSLVLQKKGVDFEGGSVESSSPSSSGRSNVQSFAPKEDENELILAGMVQSTFQTQVIDHLEDVDADNLIHYDRFLLSNGQYSKPDIERMGAQPVFPNQNSRKVKSSTGLSRTSEDIDRHSLISSIPKEFVCPLTGQLFKDPVTLETGQTFEREAMIEWFHQGNKKCPVTGRTLEYLSVPNVNTVLKHVLDVWKSEHCRSLLLLATQIAGNVVEKGDKSDDESALSIIEQLLGGSSPEEKIENAKLLISLGGLHFLTRRLELGDTEEEARVISILLCCIKADGSCRNYLAMNVNGPSILKLFHSKQISARSNAIQLLVELLRLNRRKSIMVFLRGLHTEAMVSLMHILLVYLRNSPLPERALVAVLILHFDLLVEPERYSVYRDDTVDSITMALECCLSNENVTKETQRALLMLGGQFSSSGVAVIESWLLKQAGFFGASGTVTFDCDDEVDEDLIEEEEAVAREEWLKNVALVLLGNGKRSFLDTLAKCLGCGKPDLVSLCLVTATWLSYALSSFSTAELQLSVFTVLVPVLKRKLEIRERIEHRILASSSLLNFSMNPDCRAQLVELADQICNPLRSLFDVTWTAEQLYATICGEQRKGKDNKGISYISP